MVLILQTDEEDHKLFPIKIIARKNLIWINLEELEVISDYYLNWSNNEPNPRPEGPG